MAPITAPPETDDRTSTWSRMPRSDSARSTSRPIDVAVFGRPQPPLTGTLTGIKNGDTISATYRRRSG